MIVETMKAPEAIAPVMAIMAKIQLVMLPAPVALQAPLPQ